MIKLSLDDVERQFDISLPRIRRVIKDFHAEMRNGLMADKKMLKMIPSYTDRPTGSEKGRFFAIDLGGTNLRVIMVKLSGKGVLSQTVSEQFALKSADINTTGDRLFGFLAKSVKKFFKAHGIGPEERIVLGFTFSFPLHQESVSSGYLIRWTKGFTASGVAGHDVPELLRKALIAEGMCNVSVNAITNDTVGTLAAGSYMNKFCDMGVIIGTGTNACYVEEAVNIKKSLSSPWKSETMVINIEWGNFKRLDVTRYDKELDGLSVNPGEQILEKMISGMYLGSISAIVIYHLCKAGKFSFDIPYDMADFSGKFKSEHMSEIVADNSKDLAATRSVLKKIGITSTALADRELMRKICYLTARRAWRISSAVIAAVILKMDPKLKRSHMAAIDGSIYEKFPGFSENINTTLKEIFGSKARKIKTDLVKDGSGRGAAITAARAVYLAG